MIVRAAILGMALALTFAGVASAAPAAPSFEYDTAAAQEQPGFGPVTNPAPGVNARTVGFGPKDRYISGELIQGVGPGPHPAVLFVHWLGEPATTNRTEFEADAVALAKEGVTSLLIDAPWSRRGWFGPLGTSAGADLDDSAKTVVDLRRSLDFLLKQPGVDTRRVAFVGHDFGAMFGMLMASADRRPSWYVFMAPNSSMGQWYLWEKTKPDRDAYLARLAVLDPPGYLARARSKGMLLQFSAHDIYITAANQKAIVDAAPQPREVKIYDVDHSLETPVAHADRLAWLKARLVPSR